jgi:hypothetical protein
VNSDFIQLGLYAHQSEPGPTRISVLDTGEFRPQLGDDLAEQDSLVLMEQDSLVLTEQTSLVSTEGFDGTGLSCFDRMTMSVYSTNLNQFMYYSLSGTQYN